MSGKPNINTTTVRNLAATYVQEAKESNDYIPGGLLMRDTIPGLCDEIDHLRQECRDRECTEQDVRARLADAEKTLARVRVLADQWGQDAVRLAPTRPSYANRAFIDSCSLRAALDVTS